jgi:hypothetical protein
MNSEKKIYKYPVVIDDEFCIAMPEEAQILSVQTQNGSPFLWALVDIKNISENRKFCLRGTGHLFKGNEGRFIGTFQLQNSAFIFHLFEENK